MDKEIKEKWTTALRSGEYKQGFDRLRRYDTCCCLGVLCELAVNAGVIPPGKLHSDFTGVAYAYGESERVGLLPDEVLHWASIENQTAVFNYGEQRGDLAHFNDTGLSFEEIATIIEENL